MMPSVTPFLMFEGKAEEAMTLYTSLFPNSGVTAIQRYGAGESGREGSVKTARFTLNGREFMCIDSPAAHGFTFTPSVSLFVEFDDQSALDAAFARLAEDGAVMMPLDAYPFSPRFGWVADRFGVSWQVSLAPRDGWR